MYGNSKPVVLINEHKWTLLRISRVYIHFKLCVRGVIVIFSDSTCQGGDCHFQWFYLWPWLREELTIRNFGMANEVLYKNMIYFSLFPTWYTVFPSTYNICYPLSSTCFRPHRPIIRRSKLYMQPMVLSPLQMSLSCGRWESPFPTAARQRHLQRGRIP